MKTFDENTYKFGRIWYLVAVFLMLAVPFVISIYFNAWPPLEKIFAGLLSVAPLFYTIGVIEILTYVPMLGPSGTYLGFVTGNVSGIKVPASINALKISGYKIDTPEGEVVSTLAIATSTLVNTTVLILGMLALIPLTPILESDLLAPMFANVMPAMFGALGVVFLLKDWKIASVPLAFMLVLFFVFKVPSSYVSVLVPIGIVISIAWSRFLYKKGLLGHAEKVDQKDEQK